MLMRLCVCVCVCVHARMFLYVAVEMVCSESWENKSDWSAACVYYRSVFDVFL